MSVNMAERVVVTGGAGFIGSSLVGRLKTLAGFKPIVLDIKQSNPHGVRHVSHDLKDTERLRAIFEDVQPDTVVHMASNESVSYSVDNPAEVINDITAKAVSVCEASQGIVDRVINISTTHVYGDSCDRPSKETDTPNPDSPYAAAKLSAEHIVNQYYQRGMDTVNLRYDTCYGEGMPDHMLFDDILEDCREGGPISLFGTGENTRAFTHVEDIVRGTTWVIKSTGLSGMTINIGSGESTSIRRVAELIRDEYGLDCDITFEGKSWEGDTRHIHGDITRARAILGYEPMYDIEAGIEKFVEGR